jgi:hypothetical protein
MSTNSPTRRAVLTTGALLATPIAVPAAAAIGTGNSDKRLADHEDKAAIRALHRSWLRDAATGADLVAPGETLRAIVPNHDGEETILIAADGRSATGRFACRVEIGTMLAPDCTLAQMAHAQGEGFVLRTESRILTADYAKTKDGWTIAALAFATA